MQGMDRVTDVLIIGGGITGCATAYHLARSGCQVTLLEKGDIAGEGSGRNVGGVRQQNRLPPELPMAMEALRRWPLLDEELGVATEFQLAGSLTVTYDASEMEELGAEAARQRALGLDVSVVTGKGLKELVSGLSDEVVAGTYSPTDGYANPQRATLAYAIAARRLGARLLTGVKVESIRVEGERVVGVRTARGDFSAGVVLVAAGVWTSGLCAPLGLEIPISLWRYQPYITARVPRMIHTYLRCASTRMAIVQTADGTIVFGKAPPEAVPFGSGVSRARLSSAAGELARLVPALRSVGMARGWLGWYDVTPDDLPVIGPAEGIEGLIIAAGFSGHGFALGPATGYMLSELILRGESPIPLGDLRLSRFKDPNYRREEPAGRLAHMWALTASEEGK